MNDTFSSLPYIALSAQRVLLLGLFLLVPALTRAETAVQAWMQRYSGPGGTNDTARAVAVDSGNNVIVTGHACPTTSSSKYNYTTIKYSSTGAPLWTNRYVGPGNYQDDPRAIAVDSSDNVIVTGYSYGSGTSYDYATIKYSSAGMPLWTNRYNGLATFSDDEAYAVTVDSNDNVIVTGCSSRAASSPYNYDYVTIKYSSAGSPLWTNRYNGAANNDDRASAVAVDSSGNVFVTGHSATAAAGSVYDLFAYATIKYSSAGVPLWTRLYKGPVQNDDYATALAVDNTGNVFVTGYACFTGRDRDYVTIKYSDMGVPLWTNFYNGPANNEDRATSVVVDGSGGVLVTGYSRAASIPTTYDCVTIKYFTAGVPLWTNRYDSRAEYYVGNARVVLDDSNNVLVAASSGRPTGYATMKYSSAGVPLWTNRQDYSWAAGAALDLAVDHAGNPIVTGYAYTSAGDADFATAKYICVPSPVITALNASPEAFLLRVDDVLQPGTLVIEVSTNLAAWSPLFTNTTPTNVLFYADPGSSSSRRRFYRAFQSP